MADAVYNNFKFGAMAGTFNLASAVVPVYVALLNNSYTPDVDANIYFSAVSAYQVAGSGYDAGGKALSSPALTQDDAGNYGKFDAGDWQIANVHLTGTGTVRYGVLYASAGAEAVCPLICYFDFVTDQAVTAGTFSIQWAAEGILNLT